MIKPITLVIFVIMCSVIIPIQSINADKDIHVPKDFASIQDAINAANPGSKIKIDSGTYVEQLTINKSLEINGGKDVIIQAPSVLAPNSFGAKNIIDVTGGGFC